MVNAVNNGFRFNVQQGDGTPFSIDFDAEIVKRLLSLVCTGSPQDIRKCTLVCRNWKALVYQYLYQRIAPHIFGKDDYEKYIGGDPGEEFPIPMEYLVKFRRGETLLTFAPKKLTFTQADGTVVVDPCNMVNIGKWALNAKEGFPIGYDALSSRPDIDKKRRIEDSHWSFIDICLIEKCKRFEDQKGAVLKRRERMAGLSDLSLSLLMTYVKTGERHLNWGDSDRIYQWARVPEKHKRKRLQLGFGAAGLCINDAMDHINYSIGVVVGKQSFAHLE